MSNPILNALQGQQGRQTQNPLQNFLQFAGSFNGDPWAEAQKYIQAGRVSQEQLNYCQQLANNLRPLLQKLGYKF